MLFAAGFGTRMGALTADRPKPLVSVAGKPLIDHALDLIAPLDLRTVVNTHYKAEMIAAHLAGREITISDESAAILETGGGLKNALPLLGDGPVFTMNTDAVWHGPNPLPLLQKAWMPDDMDALLLCVPLQNAVGRTDTGDFTLGKDGALNRGPGHVYTGVQIIKTDLLDEITETAFSLNLLWDKMHARGRLKGLNYPGRWADVGTPDGIALAEAMGAADV